MIIGIPKETKTWAKRVAATPNAVSQLVRAGHTVLVEKDAGAGSGFLDEDYANVGAKISASVTSFVRKRMKRT